MKQTETKERPNLINLTRIDLSRGLNFKSETNATYKKIIKTQKKKKKTLVSQQADNLLIETLLFEIVSRRINQHLTSDLLQWINCTVSLRSPTKGSPIYAVYPHISL